MEWERGNVASRFCPGYGVKILPFQRMSGSPLLGAVLRALQFFTEDGALVTLKGVDGKRV